MAMNGYQRAREVRLTTNHSNAGLISIGILASLSPEDPSPPPPTPLFWVKKEEMTEGGKAGWASKIEPGPLLSSKSGSATDS